MTNRRTPYGYTIQNGELTTVASEVAIVEKVFALYTEGSSYLAISEWLNHDGVPYDENNLTWNKHKVKRLLENPRYMGQSDYPPILPGETFRLVQRIISEKGGKRTKVPAIHITEVPIQPIAYTYTPTAESLRIQNQINHGLDHPDNPNEIIDHILQGITARYGCLTPVHPNENTSHAKGA